MASDFAEYVPRLSLGWSGGAPGDSITVAGTVLCADLSGFTRLTERLASRGREGAEELTRIVSSSFAAILGPALDEGGDVVCFGGDAATVLFTGSGAPSRAAAAAAAMQRALAAGDRIASSAGPVRLRMSIGVASGDVTLAVGGGTQRALLLLGPAASEAVRLEGTARAGGVLHTEMEATAPPRLEARFDGPASRHEAVAWTPIGLRDQLGNGPILGELRQATIAFVKAEGVAGSLLEIRDAVAVAGAVDEATRHWGVCWLGTDVGAGGVTFLIAAGAPIATEDDEERVLRAARAIVDTAPAGTVRVGIEHGVVFAGDVGHPARRTWTVMGDSVNVAARLATMAVPGQTLAGPRFVAAAPTFAAAALGARAVKGRRTPVEVFDVAPPSPAGAGRPPRGEPTSFVGRRGRRSQLEEAWGAARRGHGHALEIVGPPGIGKSRLVEELVALVDGTDGAATTLVTTDHYRQAIPYSTATALLRSVAGVDGDATPADAGRQLAEWTAATAPHLLPWLPLIADAADAAVEPTDAVASLDPEWKVARRHSAILELLELARPLPWLLVVEDLHWTDEASRALLVAIAAAAPRQRWLVCVTTRSRVLADRGVVDTVELEPLTDDEATQLVLDAARERPISDMRLGQLLEIAAGNPLFLEQLATHPLDDENVPGSIERVIAARIDTLTAGDRQLLRDTSVLGRSASLALLATLLGDGSLLDTSRWAALGEHLDVVGGVVRFRSDLTRSVAYRGLLFERRRRLHRRVADLIRSDRAPAGGGEPLDDETCGLLAVHLLEAGAATEAWPVALEAARRAVERVALADAADLFRRAMRAARGADIDPGELATAYEEQGALCQRLGLPGDALAAFGSASRLRDDPVDRARLCSRRAAVEQLRGELRQALTWGTKGLRLLDGVTDARAPGVRAQLALDQAGSRHYQGHNRESLRWAERALDAASGTDDVRLLGQVFLHLELAHSVLGDGEAIDCGRRAVELLEEAGDAKGLGDALVNIGLTAYNDGRWIDAGESYERAAKVIATTGNVIQAASVALNIAFLLADQGEVDQAAAMLADAGRSMRAAGHDLFVGYVELLGSKLTLWERDTQTAEAQLDAARARFAAHHSGQMVLDCDVTRVELLIADDRAHEAISAAERVAVEIDAFGPAELLPVTVRRLWSTALLRIGDAAGASARAVDALERARAMSARFEIALCLDAAAHACLASGSVVDPAVLEERDQILASLGVRRTRFPLARP